MTTMSLAVPRARPKGRPAGFQRWQQLLFLHWRLAPDVVQRLLPEGLEVDTFEGDAYVGIVPFTMRDVSPWWSPSVPGISNFHELNVRTYVRRNGEPGVWFFALEAAASLAVLIARTFWHLPYHRASMTMRHDGDVLRYWSERRWPGPRPARFEASYRVGTARGTARPGTVENFLLERYALFAQRRDGSLWRGLVHHEPYSFHDVELLELRHCMTSVSSLGPCEEPPAFAPYSPGVDVDVYDLERS